MQKVFPEDCMKGCTDPIDNRFTLILLAAQRAKMINDGATSPIDDQGDKPTVVAMREIAEGKVSINTLKESTAEALKATKESIISNNTYTEKYVDLNAIPEDNELEAKKALQELNSCDLGFDSMYLD